MKLEWYEIALPVLGALIGAAIGIYDYVKCNEPLYTSTALYNAGYRKIAEDEIVIKKSERVNVIAEEFEELVRKETAREIINMLTPPCKACDANWHKGCMCLQKKIIKQIAQKYGIELE